MYLGLYTTLVGNEAILKYLFFSVLLFSSVVSAATLNVPGDYEQIQTALSAAQFYDTVLVLPGTYTENIVWPAVEGIVLLSESGISSTIINGDSTGSVISFSSLVIDTNTVVSGFTITNGAANLGGGIFCSGASPRIYGNLIENCYASVAGAGIYCFNSKILIEENIITNNSAGVQYDEGTRDFTDGGGICLKGNSIGIAVIKNNTITDNFSADYGGGITCTRNAMIIGNHISDNISGWFGGGIYHLGPTTILEDNLISGNSSLWGAGVTLQGGHLTILNCEILNNVGDGLHIYYGTLDADSSTFASNTKSGIGAGPSKYSESRGASVNHCNIFDNIEFGIRSSLEWLNLDATYNWWGDPSGPSGVGTGVGDAVSRNVAYEPWLTYMGLAEDDFEGTTTNLGIQVQNPISSSADIIIKANGFSELTLFDMNGRRISTLYSGIVTQSMNINWNTTQIPPGLYFLNVSCNNISLARKAIITR